MWEPVHAVDRRRWVLCLLQHSTLLDDALVVVIVLVRLGVDELRRAVRTGRLQSVPVSSDGAVLVYGRPRDQWLCGDSDVF